jgi:hypothetical protein
MARLLIALLLICLIAPAWTSPSVPPTRPVTAASVEPVKLSWEILRDVTFKKKWYAEESVYMLYPTFGPGVQKLSGKTVELTGYVLPVDLRTVGLPVQRLFLLRWCRTGIGCVAQVQESGQEVQDRRAPDVPRYAQAQCR